MITCKQAAEMFRDAASRSSYRTDAEVNKARAEILAAFGDQPVPAPLLETFDFSKVKA